MSPRKLTARPEKRTVRKCTALSFSDWLAVEEWMKANSVSLDAEAIRRLIQLGLRAAQALQESRAAA